MFAAPFAPLLHGVVNWRVAKASEWDVARWFNLVDNRALIDEAEIEVEDIVSDEEVAVYGDLPKVLDDLGFLSLQNFDGVARRRLDGVAYTKYLGSRRREAQFLYEFRFVELELRVKQATFF